LKKVGLHVRFERTLTELIKKAVRLELPFFQCFLTQRKTGKVFRFEEKDILAFLSMRRIYFEDLYLHASYLINLAQPERFRHPILNKEVDLAKRLEFSHIVLHPGAVRSIDEKKAGIESIARMLNYFCKKEKDIQFLLENTAFGQRAIGSDIEDFFQILEFLDKPETIGFCIDTVHAHVAGYDLISDEGYKQFMYLLEKTIGFERIKLIHLNETRQECRSYVDIHCCIGDKQAQLGDATLKRFIQNKRLACIPLLTELPIVAEEDERRIVTKIDTWILEE